MKTFVGVDYHKAFSYATIMNELQVAGLMVR